MIYKHNFFILDEENKKTFDENGKELRLTGNAYRLLFFLCGRKSANLTQIGDFFDFANDYSDNHIRQYRYKINLVIGHDIIEYKNGLYSIKGLIEGYENNINERNTSLLQPDSLLFNNIVDDKINLKLNVYPAILGSILLLLSFFSWPYAFYTILRFVITAVSGYYAYYVYKIRGKNSYWLWPLIIIVVLFNPIAPIYLYKRNVWILIDIFVVCFFAVFVYFFRKPNKKVQLFNIQ